MKKLIKRTLNCLLKFMFGDKPENDHTPEVMAEVIRALNGTSNEMPPLMVINVPVSESVMPVVVPFTKLSRKTRKFRAPALDDIATLPHPTNRRKLLVIRNGQGITVFKKAGEVGNVVMLRRLRHKHATLQLPKSWFVSVPRAA